uniref:Uncharacterized protein n=1 Tax=Parascaris equorum TaxID=6256 RepID=A0A914RAN2_PAREQ
MEDEQKTYEFTLKERDEQTRRVREECEALMLELQNLLDTKQTLEAEIVQYRKLLEGEESRAGLRRLAQQWQIKRSADNGPEVVFTFPKGFILKPLKTVKIWARDQGGENEPPDQLIFDKEDSFGSGSNAKTVLVNESGEVIF